MPTPEQVERAIVEMRKIYANYEYFFEKNDSPDWIEPLWQRGFFKDPPPPKDQDGYRSFTLWPESQYLVRMVDKSPDLVARVLSALPTTENIYVHADVVEAALALPAPLARPLAESERKWIQTQSQLLWLLPDRYTDLVVSLARSGEIDAAFRLARALLDVRPHPRVPNVSEEEEKYLSNEPVAKMEHWHYERAIEKIRLALLDADATRCLKFFADLLQNAMKLAEPPREEDFSDFSYIWRPAVEDHAQNHVGYSIRDALVVGLRDVAEAVSHADPTKVAGVVEELESRKRSIFQRVALHVLTLFGASAADLARARVESWELFDDTAIRHEYVGLAQARFRSLPDEAKERLLNHLTTPPEMGENFRRNFAALHGRAPSDEDVANAKRGWEINRLAALRGHLPERWQDRYEKLLGGRREPEHPEFPSYSSGTWVGPTSPKSPQDIRALTPDGLIEYLWAWKPSGDELDASKEGLGRQLAAAVESNPEQFAPHADRFKDLDPTYVRSLLDGFENALRKDGKFTWSKVLELCEHVVAQPFEPDSQAESERASLGERDPGWRWARGSVADLLEEGFNHDAPPIEDRERTWSILAKLTEDSNPSPEHEAKYGGTNMDPQTLSLNTNRGKAMQALVRYALWIRRSDERKHPERVAQGFSVMPEVRDVLEDHLDPTKDPSRAIRSVYGQWFPWLVLLDEKWARANAARIFPGDAAPSLHDAAWEAFFMSQPFDNVFDVLRPQYRAAVEELAKPEPNEERRRFINARESLSEHLMIFYLRGKIVFNEEGSLLDRFFAVAPEKVRAHAVEFLGRVLGNKESSFSEVQLERLKVLWGRRFDVFASEPDDHTQEVGAFGWWFSSPGTLPDGWLMMELLRVLEQHAPIDDADLVVERLADLAPGRPYDAVRALRLMVPIQKELYFLHGEEPRRLIRAALISDDDRAHNEARELLDDLVARGYTGYADLAEEARE